jgi:hypothetical protein
MQKFSKLLIGAGIFAAIVLAGILVGWLGSRLSSRQVPSQPSDPSLAKTTATAGGAHSQPPANPASATNPTVSTTVPSTTTNLTAPWEDKIDEILGGDDDDTNKVKQLFALFPSLPEDGQDEVAEHLANLLSDEEYAPLGDLLKNPKLPESVLDTLIADVLNRPNAIKLPMFLELARNPEHPKAEEGRDYLELYLDEDYGDDWPKWQEKMQEWLKENPD